jgi:hypothetical protein
MKRHLHLTFVLTVYLLAVAGSDLYARRAVDFNIGNEAAGVSTVGYPVLAAPYFAPLDDQTVQETTINFYVLNPEPGASTIIYRSTTADSGYVPIDTLDPLSTDYHYFDENLAPRTTYYYKLQGLKDGVVSAFSDVIHLTTYSKMYAPELIPTPLSPYSIEIQFTDNSYADMEYEIWGTEVGTTNTHYVNLLQMLDSGRTETWLDELVEPGKTYVYEISAMINAEGFPRQVYYSDTVTTPGVQPDPPYFDPSQPPANFPCGSEIALTFVNPDPQSTTTIWRSTSETGIYSPIATLPGGANDYMDTNVSPHTTYYYKLTAERDGITSEFSEPQSFESGSDFFPPVLSATLLPDNTVQFSLQDNSYGEGSYEVYGYDQTTGLLNGFFATILSPDSGAVHTRIDTFVEPGHTYLYGVSAILVCDGFPTVGEFSVTITIPAGPTVGNLYVVNPDTDLDVTQLTDGTAISTPQANIRAEASAQTGSVVYYLDGKRSVDNSAPFALFAENNGDYKNGHLKSGTHTLTATAYSGKNGTGTEGNTVSVTFTVDDMRGNKPTGVAFYPNPIVNESQLEISGAPNASVRIEVFDQYGKFVRTLYRGNLNADGIYSTTLTTGQLKRGTYIMSVEQSGKMSTTRFSVD